MFAWSQSHSHAAVLALGFHRPASSGMLAFDGGQTPVTLLQCPQSDGLWPSGTEKPLSIQSVA